MTMYEFVESTEINVDDKVRGNVDNLTSSSHDASSIRGIAEIDNVLSSAIEAANVNR